MNSKVTIFRLPGNSHRVVLTRRSTISSVGFALDNICPRFDLKKINSKSVFFNLFLLTVMFGKTVLQQSILGMNRAF